MKALCEPSWSVCAEIWLWFSSRQGYSHCTGHDVNGYFSIWTPVTCTCFILFAKLLMKSKDFFLHSRDAATSMDCRKCWAWFIRTFMHFMPRMMKTSCWWSKLRTNTETARPRVAFLTAWHSKKPGEACWRIIVSCIWITAKVLSTNYGHLLHGTYKIRGVRFRYSRHSS